MKSGLKSAVTENLVKNNVRGGTIATLPDPSRIILNCY
jgi:hypothetical protein